MNEQDFRDYHLLLDGQAEQVFGVTDDVGARAQHWRNTQEQQLRIRSAQ
jgi:DNA-binding ferritin-like protein